MEEIQKNKVEKEKTKAVKIKDNRTADKETKIKTRVSVIIRISGRVEIKSNVAETLNRLRLRKKYSCVLVKPTKDVLGMIKKIKHSVSYGEIEKETLVKLLKERGRKIKGEKFDAEKVADELLKGESLKQLGFKPFFRLHPPRGGIKSKLQYPKGVLGNNKDINKLIERML